MPELVYGMAKFSDPQYGHGSIQKIWKKNFFNFLKNN